MMRTSSALFAVLRTRYALLAARDKRALGLMTAFAFAAVLWAGLLQPLLQSREHNALRYREAYAAVHWMQANAAGGVSASAPVGTGPVLSAATDTAQIYRIVLSHAAPAEDGSVQITLEEASFERLVSWLDALERQYAISPYQLSVQSIAEKPGMVSASLGLKRVIR